MKVVMAFLLIWWAGNFPEASPDVETYRTYPGSRDAEATKAQYKKLVADSPGLCKYPVEQHNQYCGTDLAGRVFVPDQERFGSPVKKKRWQKKVSADHNRSAPTVLVFPSVS